MQPRGWIVLLLALALAVAAFFTLGGDESSEKGPNVLLVVIDTCRADHMGFHGKTLRDGSSPTPVLDALSAESVGPMVALTPVPLTLPAHTTMFSGVGPRRHGVRENDSFRVSPSPEERGFSLLAEDLSAAGYETGGFVSGQPLWRRHGLAEGFSVYEQPERGEGSDDAQGFDERDALTTTNKALAWLEGRAARGRGEDPFFLFVHYFDPHDPYVPWSATDPHFANLGGRPAVDEGPLGAYLTEIMRVDRQIGRLLAALPDGGKDTLVIVTADHGEGLGEHGERTHGYLVHDATLRLPFVMRPPRAETRVASDEVPARLTDLYPTVLSVTGVSPVLDAPREGRDLFGPVPENWGHYAETVYPWYQFGYAHLMAWRDRERKLERGGGLTRLFAWRDDPGELQDLAAEEAERAKALGRALDRHLSRSGGASAQQVAVSGTEPTMYMASRPPDRVEPDPGTNARLPHMETRWDLVRKLEDALTALRANKELAPQVVLELEAFADERPTNPALAFWTARANQWSGRMEGFSAATQLAYFAEADRIFQEVEATFGDTRALDSRMRVGLDRWDVTNDRADAEAVVRLATGAINGGARRVLPFVFRGLARECLGDLEGALEDLKRAAAIDPSHARVAADIARVSARLRK